MNAWLFPEPAFTVSSVIYYAITITQYHPLVIIFVQKPLKFNRNWSSNGNRIHSLQEVGRNYIEPFLKTSGKIGRICEA
jgi:hypothetical protein